MTINLDRLAVIQQEQKKWEEENFGCQPAWRPAFGMFEEIGEAAHSFLKRAQGIRGSVEEHNRNLADAIGDTLVYLCGYANRRDFDLAELLAFSPPRAPQAMRGFPEMSEEEVLVKLMRDVFIRVGRFMEADDQLPLNWCVGMPGVTGSAYLSITNAIVLLVDDLCSLSIGVLGTTAQECLELAWGEVKARKWKANPKDGKSAVNTDEDAPRKKKAGKKVAKKAAAKKRGGKR